MNSNITTKLRATADGLPRMVKPSKKNKTRTVYGNELLAQGVSLVSGKAVQPERRYTQEQSYIVMEPVSHLRNITRIYNHKGIAGVEAYRQKVLKDYKASIVKNEPAKP